MNHHSTQSSARQVAAVPGFPSLQLVVYGPLKSTSLTDTMAQAYFVDKEGVATARAELLPLERHAVEKLLDTSFPEHAKI